MEVLKKNIPNKLALMGRRPGLARAMEKVPQGRLKKLSDMVPDWGERREFPIAIILRCGALDCLA